MYLQAEFNARFEAARNSRQAEVDKILDANNRMKEIWEEQARNGSGSGNGEGSLFRPGGGFDNTEDGVLSVKVPQWSIPMHYHILPVILLGWSETIVSLTSCQTLLCQIQLVV